MYQNWLLEKVRDHAMYIAFSTYPFLASGGGAGTWNRSLPAPDTIVLVCFERSHPSGLDSRAP